MGVLGVGTGPSNVAILAQMELNKIPATDRGAECRSDFVGFLTAVENTSENPVYVEMKTDGTYQALNGRPAGAPVAEKGTAQCGQQVGRHWMRQPCPSDNCEPAPAEKQLSSPSGKPSTTSSTSSTTEQPSTISTSSTTKQSTSTTQRSTRGKAAKSTPAAKQQDPKPSATKVITTRTPASATNSRLLTSMLLQQPSSSSTPVQQRVATGKPPVHSGPGINWGAGGALLGVVTLATIAGCLARVCCKRDDEDVESGTQPSSPANPDQQQALLEIEAPETGPQQQANQAERTPLTEVPHQARPKRNVGFKLPENHQQRGSGAHSWRQGHR
jgi:hypothetical protein